MAVLKKNWLAILLAMAVIFAMVYSVCNSIKTQISFTKGEMVRGSVSGGELLPIDEVVPEISVLPVRIDTVLIHDTQVIIQQVDTAKIIAEYELKRSYNLVAFDSWEVGRLELYPTIQYNKLSGIDYRFTPVVKETRVCGKKVFSPFVSGSYSSLGYMGLGGGFFYYQLGLEYQYQRDFTGKGNGHSLGLKYSF